MSVLRCFTEKKEGFDVDARKLTHELQDLLGIQGLTSVRILCRYDVEGIDDATYAKARSLVFSEPPAIFVMMKRSRQLPALTAFWL